MQVNQVIGFLFQSNTIIVHRYVVTVTQLFFHSSCAETVKFMIHYNINYNNV